MKIFFKIPLSWAAEKEREHTLFNISDGTHRAGILEVISKHGNEVISNANSLQLNIWFNQIGECLSFNSSSSNLSLLHIRTKQGNVWKEWN